MIAECMIFLATIGTPNMSMSDGDIINEYMSCKDNVPQVMFQYADLYVEHFDEENINTAVRIGW